MRSIEPTIQALLSDTQGETLPGAVSAKFHDMVSTIILATVHATADFHEGE